MIRLPVRSRALAGVLTGLGLLAGCGVPGPGGPPPAGEPAAVAALPADPRSAETALVDSILALMTLEEKVGQLTQMQGRWSETGPTVREGGFDDVRAGRVGSFLGMYGAETTRELQRVATEEARVGIPLLFAHDVIHGFRTIFPVPLAETASWDPVLVERSARIAAVEATAHGIHWTYAPGWWTSPGTRAGGGWWRARARTRTWAR